MGALDSNGIYIYDETDTISSTWSAAQNLLADSVSTEVGNRPTLSYVQARRASGRVTIDGTSVAAGSYTSTTVSYGKTLPGTLSDVRISFGMVNGPSGSGYLVPRGLSVTTTGFTLAIFNTGSSAATWTGLIVTWKAEVDL